MDLTLLLKATVLLLATLAGARVLRRASAGARHRFWTGVFAALLALPVLASIVPAIHVPLPDRVPAVRNTAASAAEPTAMLRARLGASTARPSAGDRSDVVTVEARDPFQPQQSDTSRITSRGLLVLAWLLGAVVATGALIVSLLRVRRLARSADPAIDPALQRAAHDMAERLGLRRVPGLLSSPLVATPMAAGLFRPTIFLPISAQTWSAEQRDIVLAHEIAHLVAFDPLRQTLARVAMACYWFHPFAWIAARHAAIAREQACDEVVLSLGTRPSAYARVLLDLAEAVSGAPPLHGALPMVEPSVLEKRLMTILNSDVRPTPRRMFVIPALGVALLTLTVAAAQPAVVSPTITPRAQSESGVASPMVSTGAQPASVEAIAEASLSTRTESAPAAQDLSRETPCDWTGTRTTSFSGNISMGESGGRRVVYEQVGISGGDRVIQKRFGDLRVCMIAEGMGQLTAADRPSQWIDRAQRVVMVTRRGERVQQLEISGPPGGARQTTWQVDGANRSFDQAAQQWRSQLLAVLDTTWELSMLHGQVSSLRGEISSIQGHRSSLQGEISSFRGEVSSMRGRISSLRGDESSLRAAISSIQGHVSSLRGAISSERGAISSLNASWNDRSDRDRAARIAEHEKEIARLEQAIRDYNQDARIAAVEKEIAALNVDKKVADVETRIKEFDVEGKIAAIERQIAALDVEGHVRAVERQIGDLDADRRGRQLEDRRETELRRLEAAISSIK